MATSPFELPMSSAPAGERADARRNRERILGAALRLIERNGLDCISMDEVAAEAGVGKGTLYRRFGDRSSLLRALLDEPEREFQDAILRGPPPLGPGAPPTERLHAFGDRLLTYLDRNAPLLTAAERLIGGKRYEHPVHSFYQTHIHVLLREIGPDDPTTVYLASSLIAPLAGDAFVHQRDRQGMSMDEIRAGWHTLVDAVVDKHLDRGP